MTKIDKMILAAAKLWADGKDPFTAEDLVAKAFEMYPHDFALRGYPHYPDSKAVLSKVMGKKSPLVSKGYIEKVGTQMFRITEKGLDRVSTLDATDESVTHRLLDRDVDPEMGRMIASKAFELFQADDGDRITFYQFCRFFGISARDRWQQVSSRLEQGRHIAEKAREIGEAGDSARVQAKGTERTFSPKELRLLGAVHDFLRERFRAEVQRWRDTALS